MKKLIIIVVFTLTAALSGMTTWAAVIGSGTLKKDFSSGSTLSSAEMNNNFSVIENAVNSTNALTTTLPDGANTYLSFSIMSPSDYTAGGNVVVAAYWSGCEGTDVRLGHSSRGFSVGDNSNLFVSLVTPSTWPVAVHGGGNLNYTILQSSYQVAGGFGTSNFMNFTVGRAGSDALDTCTGSLTLRGVELRYATNTGASRISIPVNTLSR